LFSRHFPAYIGSLYFATILYASDPVTCGQSFPGRVGSDHTRPRLSVHPVISLSALVLRSHYGNEI